MSSGSDRRRSGGSRRRRVALAGLLLAGAGAVVVAGVARDRQAAPAPLRVCADPNNLPFSDSARRGFENELAGLVAADLGLAVEYTWHPQRRGFVRQTLRAGRCDVVMGVPTSFELAATTVPYYRSTYVFVQRDGAVPVVRTLDDPALRALRVGVHVVGDDYANTPGAAALARRGIIENIRGYSIYGDYDRPHPPSRLIEAVAAGEIDLAIAWGPLAGYFAPRQPVPLRLTPVSPQIDPPFTPFVFDIAMGVRRGDDTLRLRLDAVIEERRPEIEALLRRYGVPLVPTGGRRLANARPEDAS